MTIAPWESTSRRRGVGSARAYVELGKVVRGKLRRVVLKAMTWADKKRNGGRGTDGVSSRLLRSFSGLDKDKTGFLSRKSFVQALRRHVVLSDTDIDWIVRTLDSRAVAAAGLR